MLLVEQEIFPRSFQMLFSLVGFEVGRKKWVLANGKLLYVCRIRKEKIAAWAVTTKNITVSNVAWLFLSASGFTREVFLPWLSSDVTKKRMKKGWAYHWPTTLSNFRHVWLHGCLVRGRLLGARNRIGLLHEPRFHGQCNGNGGDVLLRALFQYLQQRSRPVSGIYDIAVRSRTPHAQSQLSLRCLRTVPLLTVALLLVLYLFKLFCTGRKFEVDAFLYYGS